MRGRSSVIAILRIGRCTRLRLIRRPRPRGIAVMRREPRNGHAVNSSSIRRIGAASLSMAGGRGRQMPERATRTRARCLLIDTSDRRARTSLGGPAHSSSGPLG